MLRAVKTVGSIIAGTFSLFVAVVVVGLLAVNLKPKIERVTQRGQDAWDAFCEPDHAADVQLTRTESVLVTTYVLGTEKTYQVQLEVPWDFALNSDRLQKVVFEAVQVYEHLPADSVTKLEDCISAELRRRNINGVIEEAALVRLAPMTKRELAALQRKEGIGALTKTQ